MNRSAHVRGRILPRSQVHYSDTPVTLAEKQVCRPKASALHVETDPETGDILEIHIQCSCGTVTVVECHYDGEVTVQ